MRVPLMHAAPESTAFIGRNHLPRPRRPGKPSAYLPLHEPLVDGNVAFTGRPGLRMIQEIAHEPPASIKFRGFPPDGGPRDLGQHAGGGCDPDAPATAVAGASGIHMNKPTGCPTNRTYFTTLPLYRIRTRLGCKRLLPIADGRAVSARGRFCRPTSV